PAAAARVPGGPGPHVDEVPGLPQEGCRKFWAPAAPNRVFPRRSPAAAPRRSETSLPGCGRRPSRSGVSCKYKRRFVLGLLGLAAATLPAAGAEARSSAEPPICVVVDPVVVVGCRETGAGGGGTSPSSARTQ